MQSRRLAAILLLVGFSAAVPSADWPMQGRDAGRRGSSERPGPTAATVKWAHDFTIWTGWEWDNVRVQDNASPVVGPDNTVYQVTEQAVYAINPDGTLKWNTSFGAFDAGRLAAALSPDASRLYAPVQGPEGGVIALDTADGSLEWTFMLAPSQHMSYSSLAVDAQGIIYFGTTGPATLYAVTPNGTLKWSYTHPDSQAIGIEAAPAIGPDGSVYCIVNTVGLVAVDKDGGFKWNRNDNTGNYGWPTPAVLADGTVVVAGDPWGDPVVAYNPDGSTKWSRGDIGGPGGYFSGIAVSADQATVFTAREDGKMYALDAHTGATSWSSTPAAGDELAGSPVLASNGILYMMGSQGHVYAMSEQDGALLWKHQLNTPAYYWGPPSPALGSDGTLYAVAPGTVPYSGDIPARLYAFGSRGVTSDFDGDLTSDILWRHTTGGDMWLWPMADGAKAGDAYVGVVSDANWEIRGQGDFDGDGTADLLWRHKLDGTIYYWRMSAGAPAAQLYVATVDVAYDVAGTGDFDGDGQADILWRNPTVGDLWLWRMHGAEVLGQEYVDTVALSYSIRGFGDLNGDVRTDVVWQGAAGDVWAWLMHGAVRDVQAYVGLVAGATYQLQQVADFDADGKADLLWWNAIQGDVWIWRMDGAAKASEHYVGLVADTNYRIQAAGDYNGDGKADLLWRNMVAGDLWVWLMNGPVKDSEHFVGMVTDQGYQIVR